MRTFKKVYVVLEVQVHDEALLHRLANASRAKDGIEELEPDQSAGALVELLQPVVNGQPWANVDCGFEIVNWEDES